MKSYKPTAPCPCHSGRPYEACCAPYHRREREAPEPEVLMRSRFSAFALELVPYLWDTMHPDHGDRKRPRPEVYRELREGAVSFRYMGLTVLDREGPDANGIARVLFIAKLFERGRDRSFVELSEFAHDGTGWRYVAGRTIGLREAPGGDPTALRIATFPASARRE